MLALMRTAGTRYFSADGKGFTLDSPAGIDAVQRMADLSLVDHVAPSVSQSKTLPNLETMVVNGQLAMDINGSYNLAFFGDQHYKVGLGALPMFAHPGNISWTSAHVIAKGTKHAREAEELVRSIIAQSPALAASGAALPPLRSYYTNPAKFATWANNDRHPASFRGAVLVAETKVAGTGEMITQKNYGQLVNTIIGPGLDPVWAGKQTARQAIAGMAAQVRPLLTGSW